MIVLAATFVIIFPDTATTLTSFYHASPLLEFDLYLRNPARPEMAALNSRFTGSDWRGQYVLTVEIDRQSIN